MIPLIKLVSLATRTFSRPAANYFTKKLHLTPDSTWAAHTFTRLGRSSSNLIHFLENKLRKDKGEELLQLPQISDKQAKETGVELAVELVVYITAIALGLYELKKYNHEARVREEAQMAAITSLREDLTQMLSQLKATQATIEEVKDNHKASLRHPK